MRGVSLDRAIQKQVEAEISKLDSGLGGLRALGKGPPTPQHCFMLCVYEHLEDDEPLVLWKGGADENERTTLALEKSARAEAKVYPAWRPNRKIDVTHEVQGGRVRRLTLMAGLNAERHDMWVSGLMKAVVREGPSTANSGPQPLEPSPIVSTSEGPDVRQGILHLVENLNAYVSQEGVVVELSALAATLAKQVGTDGDASQSALVRRMMVVFLQLTSERHSGAYLVRVPRRNQGNSTNWLRYTDSFIRWMLKFDMAQSASSGEHPFAVKHLPQPPIVRVRAIFVMCDLRAAVRPHFQPDRQELKLQRLEDLVNAMLQWATTFEGGLTVDDLKRAKADRPSDPTMALFKHLSIPPWKVDGTLVDMTYGQLEEFLKRRTDEPIPIPNFLQVRLLIDPGKLGEADELATGEATADRVKRLVERAKRVQREKGLSEPETPVDFMPFANVVETVKGVVYWPLTASNLTPRERARFLIELTKLRFYENQTHLRIKIAREYVPTRPEPSSCRMLSHAVSSFSIFLVLSLASPAS